MIDYSSAATINMGWLLGRSVAQHPGDWDCRVSWAKKPNDALHRLSNMVKDGSGWGAIAGVSALRFILRLMAS